MMTFSIFLAKAGSDTEMEPDDFYKFVVSLVDDFSFSKVIVALDYPFIGCKSFAKEADMLIYKMKHAGVVTMEKVTP